MSLQALMAKQRAAADAKKESSNVVVTDSNSVNVDRAASDGNSPSPAPAKLAFGVKGKTAPATPTPAPAPKVVESVEQVATGTAVSLDDIAGDESIDTGGRNVDAFTFADEIPATAPTRELPEDLTGQQKAFVESLNSMYEIVHDPELFGQMIRTIMSEMQENPNHAHLLADEDVHVMMRGLRSSMGLAKIKKATKSTKSRSAKPVQAAAMAGTLDEMFNSDDWS